MVVASIAVPSAEGESKAPQPKSSMSSRPTVEASDMTPKSVEVLDTTVHKTYEWLRDIAIELGVDNRRYAYLALRGIYFEGWDPSSTPERDRSLERFLGRVEAALERALWNEEYPIDVEQAARAVLRVLSDRISGGEMDQVRRVMPERIRDLWPTMSVTD